MNSKGYNITAYPSAIGGSSLVADEGADGRVQFWVRDGKYCTLSTNNARDLAFNLLRMQGITEVPPERKYRDNQEGDEFVLSPNDAFVLTSTHPRNGRLPGIYIDDDGEAYQVISVSELALYPRADGTYLKDEDEGAGTA